MIATVVDAEALWQTAVASLAAGIGTTVIFSFTIVGAARFTEASRDGRSFAAALYGGVAVIGLVGTVAAVVAAVIVMTSK